MREGLPSVPVPSSGSPQSLGLAVGADIPPAAVEFCIEELGIERIPRRHELAARPADMGDFHVVVIGSGVGGINAAINLKECGIPFTVLDKNDDVGGTWHDNRYPGCRVDVPSLAYSHSFGLHYPWDHWFAPQGENNGYLQWCVDTFGVRDHIRFSTEVTAMTWDEDTATWLVDVKDADGNTGHADGQRRDQRGRVPVPAEVPDHQGDGDVRRPGVPHRVVGPRLRRAGRQAPRRHRDRLQRDAAGARARALGATVTVFQRRPSWIFEVPIYRAELPEGVKWLDRNMPYYRNFEKFRAIWMVGDHVAAAPFMRDPAWDDPDSLSEINQRRAPGQPGLPASASSGTDPTCSRRARRTARRWPRGRSSTTAGWMRSGGRTSSSSPTPSGGSSPRASSPSRAGSSRPMPSCSPPASRPASSCGRWRSPVVTGPLHELWAKDGARAYLGITMPGFPNLFCIYGPNTNSNQGTIPTMGSELQTRYAIAVHRGAVPHRQHVDRADAATPTTTTTAGSTKGSRRRSSPTPASTPTTSTSTVDRRRRRAGRRWSTGR